MANDKRKPEEMEKGAPKWMITFADMMMLLLCFFVLMYSFSTLDEGMFEEFISSFQGRDRSLIDFAGTVGVTQMMGNGILQFPVPAETSAVIDELEWDREAMVAQHLRELMELFPSPFETYFDHLEGTPQQGGGGVAIIVHDNFTVQLSIESDLLFASGSADPGNPALFNYMISGLASVIAYAFHEGDAIIVEGHTDNIPLSPGARFRDNWELSTARANTVVRALQRETGLPGEVFRSMGRSEYYPVADNATPEGRAQNRRVVIFIEASALSDFTTRFIPPSGNQGAEVGAITHYLAEYIEHLYAYIGANGDDDVYTEDANDINDIETEDTEED